MLTAFAGFLVSWNLPEAYRSLQEPNDKTMLLDYVIVEVNGTVKKVSRNEEISFVRGDILNVNEAYLKDSKKVINLLGIASSNPTKELLDIRKKSVDSSLELIQKEEALDPEGAVYALIAQSGKTLHGAIFLRRVEPTLSYIDVLINDKIRVMREGESLQVKKSDHFKVVNVVTNIRDKKDVSFAVEILGTKTTGNVQNYQIVFRNKKYVFAKIPLAVENI